MSKSRMRMLAMIAVTTIGGSLLASAASRVATKDISAVINDGKFEGNRYLNSYFGLEFTAEGGHAKAGNVVNIPGRRAQLVDAVSDSGEPDESYSFAILADNLENYPQLITPAQYLRSVRHALEKEGLWTIREEFPVEISGKHFIGAIMGVKGEQVPYFRGMYSTFLHGYILSFDLTARKQEVIERKVSTLVRFHSLPD